ncbi:hypothetical protein [Alicyclobacillus ferrooxydans]|uniref:Uncharacterized protein n=1 Tax=Alicyclobacillus ferrooxydans TaxID=471514 RepID=A0A0P9GS95_9BACL|nr:hypothetical protein [Alicyclobacillus ferrooxydans]KPV43889.1 hypothetical protein AN477_10010 [Alicyclobacillus ferrooxydans]
MSAHPSPPGAHINHHENIDSQGNANLAVWAGLVALTFMTATFVASNVYLRGWSPTKFVLKSTILKDLPYYSVLLSVISAVLLVGAATFFVKDRWGAFNGTLGLATLFYIGLAAVQFQMMLRFGHASPQSATIYAPTAIVQFLLTVVGVILLAVAGWYSGFASKAKINAFFPVAMNVWLYTAASGIVILLLEDVLTVGQFAAWCGQHLT